MEQQGFAQLNIQLLADLLDRKCCCYDLFKYGHAWIKRKAPKAVDTALFLHTEQCHLDAIGPSNWSWIQIINFFLGLKFEFYFLCID